MPWRPARNASSSKVEEIEINRAAMAYVQCQRGSACEVEVLKSLDSGEALQGVLHLG